MKLTSLNKRDIFYAKGTASIQNAIARSVRRNNRQVVIANLIREIENGTNFTLAELKKDLNEQNFFFIALQHVVTTKKLLCLALDIPIESACRYKRYLEKSGQLVQSSYRVICPITKHQAHLITTNPKEFDKITEDYNRQLALF